MGGGLATILPSLSACRRDKPPMLRYMLAMYMGHSTDSVMESNDSLSYTVPIVGFTVILQSTC